MTVEAAMQKLSFEGEVQLAESVVEALEKKKAAGIKKPDEAIARIVEEAQEMEKTEGKPVTGALREGIKKEAEGRESRDLLQPLDEMPDLADHEIPDRDSGQS